MYKIKDKLITRNKKYNYKLYEHEKYSIMSGYEYSYFITDYNETKTIKSGILNYNAVLNVLEKIKTNNGDET